MKIFYYIRRFWEILPKMKESILMHGVLIAIINYNNGIDLPNKILHKLFKYIKPKQPLPIDLNSSLKLVKKNITKN